MGSTLQKEVQLGFEEQLHLHDLTCLWIYVRGKMSATFTGEVMARHETLFEKGYLGVFNILYVFSLAGCVIKK